MIRNLVAARSDRKPILAKSGRRLRGWINYRVSKSTKPWVELRLNEFVELTGISIRTCRRQLEILRTDPAHDIVIRTIHENRRWKLFASTTGRLHGLKRSEPYTRNACGVSSRIVKIHKHDSRQLKEEQLYLGADPHYWKAKSNDTLDTKFRTAPELCSATPDHPEQETLNLLCKGVEQRTENPCVPSSTNHLTTDQEVGSSGSVAHYTGGVGVTPRTANPLCTSRPIQTHFFGQMSKCHFSYKYMRDYPRDNQRYKHRRAGFGQNMTNLAFHIARRELAPLHWDNCKPGFEIQYAVFYARESLKCGVQRTKIVKAYDIALHKCHEMAVDAGVTEAGSWRASSTISRARKLLAGADCYDKWKPNPNYGAELPLAHWSGSN